MSEFRINGETFHMLDPNKVTFAEAAAVERVTGHSFGELQSNDSLMQSVMVVQALIWISVKRTKPEFKFSDLNDLPIDAIEWVEEEGEAADPSEPAEAGREASETGA